MTADGLMCNTILLYGMCIMYSMCILRVEYNFCTMFLVFQVLVQVLVQVLLHMHDNCRRVSPLSSVISYSKKQRNSPMSDIALGYK